MSTPHNSLVRLVGWCRTHALLVAAAAATLGLVVLIFITTFRLYDDRQASLAALRDANISFCNRGNDLRAALREYLRQTIVIRPVPPGLDPDARVELEERNRASQAALERGDRVFAPVDCAALAAQLRNPMKGTA